MRHSYGTHCARFGVSPWQLMEWMGHKRIDETMGYVHLVERKPRPIPTEIVEAGMKEIDPTTRVLAQLAARAGKNWPKPTVNRESWPDSEEPDRRWLVGSGGGFRTPDPAVNSRLLYH